MNEERVRVLRDHIENLPEEMFDMRDFSRGGVLGECRTKGCLAGWTLALFAGPFDNRASSKERGYCPGPINEDAAALLGLDDLLADALFFLSWPREYDPFKKADAVRLLDEILANRVSVNARNGSLQVRP